MEFERNSEAPLSPSLRERTLLRKLADHHCGTYFINTLEGFIHNINGPLQILWIRSEQLQQDIVRLRGRLDKAGEIESRDLSERMGQRIDSILKALDELNAGLSLLTKDILAKRQFEKEEVDVNEVIEDTFSLMKADMFLKHRVDKVLELDDSLPTVRGRYTDLCVVMAILIQNALEAMVDSETRQIRVKTHRQGDHVLITVQDTGCGISEEDLSRIFEPFFTTKGKRKYEGKSVEHAGFGLGLVSLLLEDCRGKITCQSTPDTTMFSIGIPCYSHSSSGPLSSCGSLHRSLSRRRPFPGSTALFWSVQ